MSFSTRTYSRDDKVSPTQSGGDLSAKNEIEWLRIFYRLLILDLINQKMLNININPPSPVGIEKQAGIYLVDFIQAKVTPQTLIAFYFLENLGVENYKA